jgi:hypothetical protein
MGTVVDEFSDLVFDFEHALVLEITDDWPS